MTINNSRLIPLVTTLSLLGAQDLSAQVANPATTVITPRWNTTPGGIGTSGTGTGVGVTGGVWDTLKPNDQDVVVDTPKPTLSLTLGGDGGGFDVFDWLQCTTVLGPEYCDVVAWCRDGWHPAEISKRLGTRTLGLAKATEAEVRRALRRRIPSLLREKGRRLDLPRDQKAVLSERYRDASNKVSSLGRRNCSRP